MRLIGMLLILVGVGCAGWGYLTYLDGADAEQTASDVRAGKSPFENDPQIKQDLLAAADRDAVKYKTFAIYWFGAGAGAVVVGIWLSLKSPRRSPVA